MAQFRTHKSTREGREQTMRRTAARRAKFSSSPLDIEALARDLGAVAR